MLYCSAFQLLHCRLRYQHLHHLQQALEILVWSSPLDQSLLTVIVYHVEYHTLALL
jgi:hypothetical protein